ncbi:MAG: hypothetical protein ABIR48_05760 [Gammaproteobacteria bacterium]
MKKQLAVVILATLSSGVWANEFIKGFHRPDGSYVAGRTQPTNGNQLSQAPRLRANARDAAEPEDESLVAAPQDLTLGGTLGNAGRRDPRVLRNADAIEQIVEQENGEDGIVRGDSFYVRKSVANEYKQRRIPNSLRTNEAASDYHYTANSYVVNNEKLNKYREMFQSNR